MSTTFLKRALSPVANYAALPATGSALKLYLDEATGNLWRWDPAEEEYVQAASPAADIAAHASAADPHGDRADAASKYQPLSAGKGLSTEDYTTDEKSKLAGIAAGATANTASTANPLQAGTAAPGTAAPYAREDHRHPVDTSREPAIASGTVSQFWSGTKTWRDVATDVRASVLTGYAIADTTIISATDTVIGALQKLDARIDEAAYQLQSGAAELAIPLSYTGTGAGVLTMKLFSDIAQTATIDGAGKFYTDAAGTLNEATSYAMAANAWTVFYIKVPSSTCTMRVPSGRAIRYFGNAANQFIIETANGPKVNNLATTKIGQSVGSIYVNTAQSLCVISGQTYPWLNATRVFFSGNSLTVSGTTYPWTNAMLVYFYGNSLTISGTTYPWLNATQVFFYGNSLTVSGTTYPWISATQVFFYGSSLTVSGTTYPWTNATLVLFSGNSLTVSGTTYPWVSATQVYFYGNSLTVSADLSTSALYAGTGNLDIYINGTSITASYPTTRAWPRNISRVYIHPATGSMVSADVDRILIDIASTASLAAVGSKVIDLGGNCGAHTSASNAAIATLTGLGFTVTVN